MGIFDRMGKVIQSNLNALLERAEDDKKLIELNLDEMDQQIKAGQQEVISAVAGEKQLRKKCDDLRIEVERWDKRAELALKSGDEALAREALKQKKRVSGELDVAERARVEQGDAALKMKADLERMKEKLAALRLRKGVLVTRATEARSAGGAEQLGAKGRTSAFENFRRMEEKIEGREAETAAIVEVEESLRKGGPSDQDVEAKFRELEGRVSGGGPSSSDIDDDLAALKKRIRV